MPAEAVDALGLVAGVVAVLLRGRAPGSLDFTGLGEARLLTGVLPPAAEVALRLVERSRASTSSASSLSLDT